MALIAPEIVIYWAMCQKAVASQLADKYRDRKWTLTHGFFAVMGGFMLYEDDKRDRIIFPDKLDNFVISRRIYITEEEILDKSKGDALTKGFVLLQTSWVFLQLLARPIARLPVSELEIVSLAFVVLNFVTYGLWWHKPQDVEFSIPVGQYRAPLPDEAITERGTETFWGRLRSAFRPPEESSLFEREHLIWWLPWLFPVELIIESFLQMHPVYPRDEKRVPTFYDGAEGFDNIRKTSLQMSSGVAAIFGAIHCTAWSFRYPTSAEGMIWRITSVVIVVCPLLLMFLLWLGQLNRLRIGLMTMFIFMVLALLYITARIILLVLPFLLLRSLAPDTYTTVHWTTFIPHI